MDIFFISFVKVVVLYEEGGILLDGLDFVKGFLLNNVQMINIENVGIVNGFCCDKYLDWLFEFFCFGCSILICLFCVVREYRKRICECVFLVDVMERQRFRV